MHRAAAAARGAGLLAEQLGHHDLRVGSARDRLAVLAVGGDQVVLVGEHATWRRRPSPPRRSRGAGSRRSWPSCTSPARAPRSGGSAASSRGSRARSSCRAARARRSPLPSRRPARGGRFPLLRCLFARHWSLGSPYPPEASMSRLVEPVVPPEDLVSDRDARHADARRAPPPPRSPPAARPSRTCSRRPRAARSGCSSQAAAASRTLSGSLRSRPAANAWRKAASENDHACRSAAA